MSVALLDGAFQGWSPLHDRTAAASVPVWQLPPPQRLRLSSLVTLDDPGSLVSWKLASARVDVGAWEGEAGGRRAEVRGGVGSGQKQRLRPDDQTLGRTGEGLLGLDGLAF